MEIINPAIKENYEHIDSKSQTGHKTIHKPENGLKVHEVTQKENAIIKTKQYNY